MKQEKFLTAFKSAKRDVMIAAKSFDAVQDVIMLVDKQNQIVRCNLAAEKFYNLTAEKIVGIPYFKMIYGSTVPFDHCPLLVAQQKLLSNSIEIALGDKWVRVSANPLLDKAGNFEYCLLIVSDISGQKQLELVLKENEAKYKSMAEAIPVSIYLTTGTNQDATYLNHKFIEMFGYTLDEIPTVDHWWPLAYPDETYRTQVQEDWRARVNLALQTGRETEPLEVIVTCKDGSKKYILFSYSKLDEYNLICGIDLSERRKAEEALRESEERYALAVSATNDGIWDWNLETQSEYFSPRWMEIIGYQDGDPELLHPTASWTRRIHPEDKEMVLSRRYSLTPENNYYYAEYRHLHKSGVYRWLRSTGRMTFRQDGVPTRMTGSILDITDRKIAEEALKENELKYRRLVENSPDIIYVYSDKKGRIYYSPVVESILGYSPDYLYEHPFLWNESIHPDDKELIRSAIQDSQNGQPYSLEYRIKDSQGEWLWFLDRSIERSSSQNGETLIEGMVTNITIHKKADEELTAAKEKAEEGNRLKSAFLNNMSHEVRTPMTAIIGFSNLLQTADEEERMNYVEIIKKSSDQLLTLFEDIIHISRLQSEKLPVKLSEFNPVDLLKEVTQLYSHPDYDKGLPFKLNIPSECKNLVIISDTFKIRQVLANLVSNAYKYTFEGTIELGFEYMDGQIEFYVSDSGMGIPEKEHELIFNHFYRGEQARNLAIGGTGLGLNIARELIQLLGGTISVESQHGKGSRFYFSLPVTAVH